MSKFGSLSVLVILGLAAIVGGASVYTVKETEQALVLQFGNPVHTEQEAGLHFKTPFLQNVIYLDKRILLLDTPEQEVITEDQKRIIVDAFTEYRILDPLKVYQTVRNIMGAELRLSTIINSNMREVLGRMKFSTILSGERDEMRQEILKSVADEAEELGVEIVDVRIRRTDLPIQNSQNIFQRMEAEREREAREARALGEEEAVRIRSSAEKERTILLAEAERESQKMRGQGDAIAARTFAEAFNKDPEFYEFYRSLQAYREAINKGDTTMVLSPDSEFFRYFGNKDGK
ncbi:protease modulator HflC [Luteithermobacter gelatinilyticus]|uniref:protease modulator HflC n=1 Tax=Luteithermobacter gelatinilyticus TaxID=2582913 RepID=UPI001106E2C2|nr:protease modulator HflC [Luteithermobacter gelatinilyticus]|tara:strand:+ start:36599 stop:37468 length:870 start_codon:yes stop_codon:yes gene_type:complete